MAEELKNRWKAWVQGGAICAEMESATLLTLGAIYRLRTGSVTLIAINQERPDLGVISDTGPMIGVAVKAIEKLIEKDRLTGKD